MSEFVMSPLDWFVVAWWVLAFLVGLPSLVVLWRLDQAERSAAAAASSPANRIAHGRLRFDAWALSRQRFFGWSVCLLSAGLAASFWLSHWTELMLVNFWIFASAIGLWILATGLSLRLFEITYPGLKRGAGMALRGLAVLVGLLVTMGGVDPLIGYLARPRQIIEGPIDELTTTSDRFLSAKFYVRINGRRYEATRDAYSPLRSGERIRAEVVPGSGVIVRAEPIAATFPAGSRISSP